MEPMKQIICIGGPLDGLMHDVKLYSPEMPRAQFDVVHAMIYEEWKVPLGKEPPEIIRTLYSLQKISMVHGSLQVEGFAYVWKRLLRDPKITDRAIMMRIIGSLVP